MTNKKRKKKNTKYYTFEPLCPNMGIDEFSATTRMCQFNFKYQIIISRHRTLINCYWENIELTDG